MTSDALIALAERQLGLLTRRQALEQGWSPGRIDRAVAARRWVVERPGVYRIAGAPASREQALLAACLACRSGGSAVSHRAAADVHGARIRDPLPLEVSVWRGTMPRLHGVVVHRSRDLGPDQIQQVGALPVTTPTRVLVDLGQVEPWWIVGDVLDTFLARRLVTIDGVRLALAGHSKRGRTGCGALRRVLEHRGLLLEEPDSVLELAFSRLMRDHGLPTFDHQHPVMVGGRQRRIDFALPHLRLAIELDGYEHHSGTERFDDDRARADELVLAGWTVLRFTWQQVIHRPEWVASVVRRALDRAAA